MLATMHNRRRKPTCASRLLDAGVARVGSRGRTSANEGAALADSEIEVNGGIVVYELLGPADGEVVVLTPGGRFSKDYGGVHELADALVAGGKRVLLWDRPNCGKSDIQLYGPSDSHMRAET